MTAIRSPMVIASTWSWVTYIKVVPSRWCIFWSSIRVWTRSIASRLDSGSSSRKTRGDVLEPRQHAQGGRLAAAGGPDQDHELGVPNRKAEVIHGRRFGRELLGDVFIGDGRHGKILIDHAASL